MDKKAQAYKLLKKQNGRMFFKAILYYIFTPILMILSIFALSQIVGIAKIVAYNFKSATNIFKNTIAPKSYKSLKEYKGEYDEFEKYFREKENKIHITPNFLLIKTKNSFDIIPKTSVVWFYCKQETSRLNYGRYASVHMQTNIDFSAILCTENGKKYQSRISQSRIGMVTRVDSVDTMEIINEVIKALPNAVIGYSKELEKMYKNNPRTFLDKNGIIK